ncbi:MAG TPA: CsbD family protein [Pirellulales bacterium]|nr:CsbD family protein [Pirellulales bacterium]
MNTQTVKGNLKQLKGKLKERWGMLTDDDLKVIEGRSDQLVGKLQERYGYAKEQAEREAKEFMSACERCES